MDSKRVLSLLGLALRGGNLAVGEEPVESAARAKDARVILLAADAAAGTCRRAEHFAEAGQCLWLHLPFEKAELGMALGRASVAVAAVTDAGLASAVLHRLAEGDSGRYGEAAAKMELKAQRARERKAERAAHEKNVRRGKRKTAKPPERPAEKAGPAKKRADKAAPAQQRTARGGPSRPAAGRGRPGPGARAKPYAHSHPVKKGKGSFRKREG